MRALPLVATFAATTAFAAFATFATFATTTALPAQDIARDTAEATAKPKKLAVRVLYAGDEDHPRTEQWRQFLGNHFTKVETIQLSELSQKTTEGFDVVIVDGPTPYKPNRKFKWLPPPVLGEEYDRPTILMGAAGGSTVRSAKIKIGWL